MHVDDLLSRLEGVRQNGANHWVARCPAHTDKFPSLSIACGEDGRILLHDFGGCKVHDVLAAVGLSVGDLFEERLRPTTRAERREALEGFRRHSWQAALRVACRSLNVVLAAGSMVQRGVPFSDHDREVLAKAVERLEAARAVLAPGGSERDLARLQAAKPRSR